MTASDTAVTASHQPKPQTDWVLTDSPYRRTSRQSPTRWSASTSSTRESPTADLWPSWSVIPRRARWSAD